MYAVDSDWRQRVMHREQERAFWQTVNAEPEKPAAAEPESSGIDEL
jgi:hypothetical protein